MTWYSWLSKINIRRPCWERNSLTTLSSYICIDNDRTMVMAWLLSSSVTPGMPAMSPAVRMSVSVLWCVTINCQDEIPHSPGDTSEKFHKDLPGGSKNQKSKILSSQKSEVIILIWKESESISCRERYCGPGSGLLTRDTCSDTRPRDTCTDMRPRGNI